MNEAIFKREWRGKMQERVPQILEFYCEVFDNVFFKSIGRPVRQILTDEKYIDDIYIKFHAVMNFPKKKSKQTFDVKISYSLDDGTNYTFFSIYEEEVVPFHSKESDQTVFFNSENDKKLHLQNLAVSQHPIFRLEIFDHNKKEPIASQFWSIGISNTDEVHQQRIINSKFVNNLTQPKINYLAYRDKFGEMNGNLDELSFKTSLLLLGFIILPSQSYYLRILVDNVAITENDIKLYVDKSKVELPFKKYEGFVINEFAYLGLSNFIEVTGELPLELLRNKLSDKILIMDSTEGKQLSYKVVSPVIQLRDENGRNIAERHLPIFVDVNVLD